MSYALTNSENGKNSFVGVRQNFNQQTSSVGRPAKNDVPLNEIAQRIGIPRTTLVEARQHVDTVKEIPALESQPKQAVIQVGRELKKITDPVEREQYKEVLTIVPNLGSVPNGLRKYLHPYKGLGLTINAVSANDMTWGAGLGTLAVPLPHWNPNWVLQPVGSTS